MTGNIKRVNATLFYLSRMTGLDELPNIEKPTVKETLEINANRTDNLNEEMQNVEELNEDE